MYKINEIFYSLQGEGFHTGTPSVFVRFSGCNLRCGFCDTHHEPGTMMSLPEIVDAVASHPVAALVVLTGGEPTLWADEPLVRALQMTGKRIAIETNGTRPVLPCIDWVTLSPKSGFPGGDTVPCVLTRCDELKVVYLGQDLSQYDTIEARHRFLQPCYSDNPAEREQHLRACIDAVMNNPGWRLSLQTHRTLGLR